MEDFTTMNFSGSTVIVDNDILEIPIAPIRALSANKKIKLFAINFGPNIEQLKSYEEMGKEFARFVFKNAVARFLDSFMKEIEKLYKGGYSYSDDYDDYDRIYNNDHL